MLQFHLGISCTVFVLICTVVVLHCFVMCGHVCVCVGGLCNVWARERVCVCGHVWVCVCVAMCLHIISNKVSPCLHYPATCPCPEPDQSNPRLPSCFLKIGFNVFHPYVLLSSKWSFR